MVKNYAEKLIEGLKEPKIGTYAEELLEEVGTKEYKRKAILRTPKRLLKEEVEAFKVLGEVYKPAVKYVKGKAKRIKRGLPKSKKISSKAGELFMAKIKQLQKQKDKAIAAQMKERARWIKEMKRRKAMIKQQQAEAAEMVAAEQRSKYEQPDAYLDSPNDWREQEQNQDEYGRPLGQPQQSYMRQPSTFQRIKESLARKRNSTISTILHGGENRSMLDRPKNNMLGNEKAIRIMWDKPQEVSNKIHLMSSMKQRDPNRIEGRTIFKQPQQPRFLNVKTPNQPKKTRLNVKWL